MSSSAPAKPTRPPKIDQTSFQACLGLFLGIALIVATGRIVIRARGYKSHGFTIDDGFFLLAVITFLAGTVSTYVEAPEFYLQENITAGLESPPSDFIARLIRGEKLNDASTSLIGAAIVSVKFSFLFFFRALLRHQKRMMIWWWCIFAIMILTAIVTIFACFILCAYWDNRIFVKCVGPVAFIRYNAVLRSITVLDIVTDAFLISIPVILLWNVQIGIRRKLALGGILCLSICTITMSIIRLAGASGGAGTIDTAWVLVWYDAEAAVAIIVVSVTAFRALFVAHQARRYRSPAEKASSSWNFWSRKTRSSGNKKTPEVPVPPPVLGGVRTHIRGSQYGGKSYEKASDDMELPLHGPGITVTQVVRTEKTPRNLTRPSAESFV